MTATSTSLDDDPRQLVNAVLSLRDPRELLRQREPLERAATLARNQGSSPHTLGCLQLQLTRLHAHRCDHELTFRCGAEAIKQLERAGDHPRSLQAALICIGTCVEIGDTPRALNLSRRALARAREMGDVCMQVRLLVCQAFAFSNVDECEAAVRCTDEALRLCTGLPADHAEQSYAHAMHAAIRILLSDKLAQRGNLAEARVQRQLARDTLPRTTVGSPLGMVHIVLRVLSWLGDDKAARPVACDFLRRVRGRGGSPYWRMQARLTMGLYHLRGGHFDKAALRIRSAVETMRPAGRLHQLPGAMRELAVACAARGLYAEGLHWLRESHAGLTRLQPERVRLYGRMMALQRDVEWRRVERETVLLHTRRLAVVGRLMAQIYHSLEAPLVNVSSTLSQCLDEVQHLPSDELTATLRGVVARIGEASSLARQLKMFSYRAAPQIMELDLRLALHEAWQGMSIGRDPPLPPLVLRGKPPPPVRGDAQRLAVLLRILLIEIERMGGLSLPSATLSTQGAAVRVEFTCAYHPTAAGLPPGVGFTLCEEIAREMQGELWRLDGVAGEMMFALELPSDS